MENPKRAIIVHSHNLAVFPHDLIPFHSDTTEPAAKGCAKFTIDEIAKESTCSEVIHIFDLLRPK
jgi:hypothetical protein